MGAVQRAIHRTGTRALFVIAAGLIAAGCATTIPRNGIHDSALAERAQVEGMPRIRFWGDETPADVKAAYGDLLPTLSRLTSQAHRGPGGRPIVETLALSGGGSDGAFGAGYLAGWTARGDRPQFEVVTGVSAGAIIAPFAFLGPSHDRHLKQIWTEYQTSEVVITQILPGLLGGPALADTAPLAKLINRYVDEAFLAEIAAEYRKGRILMVGTTNLDAERPVVWNMGEIAASGNPRALQLFRKVILASSAIPGAFPPVSIDVEVDGKVYDEMHVDGGTTREVFVMPLQISYKQLDQLYPEPPIRKLFIVKNGKLTPEQTVVAPKALNIASRAIWTLTKSQNQNDIYRIYRSAKDGNAEFNLVAVPPTFTRVAKEFFDPEYQSALFETGYQMGLKGDSWMNAPPVQRGRGYDDEPVTEPKIKKRLPIVPKPETAPADLVSKSARAPRPRAPPTDYPFRPARRAAQPTPCGRA